MAPNEADQVREPVYVNVIPTCTFDCITAVGGPLYNFEASSVEDRLDKMANLGIDTATGEWAVGYVDRRSSHYMIIGSRGDLKNDLEARHKRR